MNAEIKKHVKGITEARVKVDTWMGKNKGLLRLLIRKSPRSDMVLVAQRLLEESDNLERSLCCAERVIELLTEDNEGELLKRLDKLQPMVFAHTVKVHSLEGVLMDLAGE